MKGFILYSPFEKHRAKQVEELIASLPFPIEKVNAIFPDHTRIPFQQRLLQLAKQRTSYPLVATELGCLLGHRKIWRSILSEQGNNDQHYLVLESDSVMRDADFFAANFFHLTKDSDIFFWGAFDGRMKLFSSTVSSVNDKYRVGTPLINSLYCMYGYSLNKKMASWMLKRTARMTYPGDHFKRHFRPKDVRIGGILPEVISGNNRGGSQTRPGFGNKIYWYFFDKLVDFKNELITRFN